MRGSKSSRKTRRRRSAVGACCAESEDRNRVHVVGELAASEVQTVKDFLASERMQDVFKRVNAMSTAPIEFVFLEEPTP